MRYPKETRVLKEQVGGYGAAQCFEENVGQRVGVVLEEEPNPLALGHLVQ